MKPLRLVLQLMALAALLVTAIAAAASPGVVHARTVSLADARVLDVSIEMTTDPKIIYDHNACATGPQVAYIGFRVTNTSGAPITGLRATASGFGGGFDLMGAQNPEHYIGVLAPGASRYVYYLISRPCSNGTTRNITLTVHNTSDSRAQVAQIVATRANSANAGGAVASNILGEGAIVGQTIHMDATYTFGSLKVGDTYNVQPVSNVDFNAACLVLTSMEVIASSVPSITVGETNRMFWLATVQQGGNSNPVTIRYYFKYSCTGVVTTAWPFATSLSGNQMKYTGDFDGDGGDGDPPDPFPPPDNPFELEGATTLTVTPQILSTGGTVSYTMSITNSTEWDANLDSLAVVLPTGVVYDSLIAGSITVANASEVPVAGSTGRIVFRGIPDESFFIGANSTITLSIKATVWSVAGSYTASAYAYAGSTELSGVTATFVVGADVQMTAAGPDTAIVGLTARYVVTTSNVGPANATDVVPRLTIPAGMTFSSASRGGMLSGGAAVFPPIAALAVGASVVDTVVLNVTGAGTKLLAASSTATSADSLASNHDGSQPPAQVSTLVIALTVSVTPSTPGPVNRLPGSGYTAEFGVQNTSVIPVEFSLGALSDSVGGFLGVSSIAGTGVTVAGATGTVTLAASQTVNVTVTYSVGVGSSETEHLLLGAVSTLVPSVADTGVMAIRRAVPEMIVVRSVDSPTTVPGAEVQHTIETQNIGEDMAETVQVTDSVGAPLQFKLGSLGATLLGGLSATVEFTADGVDWSYVPVSGGCGAPVGYDGCVGGIRWNIAETVPVTTATVRAAVFTYRARVP